MAFSGKENNIGTAGWQSLHYVAFTRLSLYHFAPMDGDLDSPDEKFEVCRQFKRVRVVWFCLVSHLLTEDDIPSMRIDHYVKLFLSACRRFWLTSHDELTGDECADETTTVDTEDDQLGEGIQLNESTSRPSKRRKTSKKSQATNRRKKGFPFLSQDPTI